MLIPFDFSLKNAIVIVVSILSFVFGRAANADSLPIAQDSNGKYLTDRLIVVCEYSSPTLITGEGQANIAFSGFESIDLLCQKHNVCRIEPFYPGKLRHAELIREVSRMYIFHFAGPTDILALIPDFSADSQIEFAERYSIPDPCYIPNDPDISDQWYLERTDAYQAWDTVRGDTTRIAKIAIVDTGIYWDHPDLAANIWINDAEDANHNGIFDDADNDGIDADSNGYVDDVIGWDMGQSDNNPAENTPTHGTAVAGAASEVTDNGIDGAAVGYGARLMVVKGSNQSGQLTSVYVGMIYAADQGAKIINCAWGSPYYSYANQNIINNLYYDSVLVVASAGAQGDTIPIYPGGYNHVLAVGGTDENDHITSYSNRGTWVDVYAPSDNIYTTWAQSSMTTLSGNSFSAAMTCGLAALIKSWNPGLGPDGLEATIESSADSIGNLNPSQPNAIRINCNNWLITGIHEAPNAVPERFTLLQNYPNPFNAQTEIRFVLAAESDVKVTIFDIAGRVVIDCPCGILPAGFHSIRLDGKGMPSGVFLYRVEAGEFSSTQKCLLIK